MKYRINDFILKNFCIKSSTVLTHDHLTFTFEDLGLFYSPIGVRPPRVIGLDNDGTQLLVNCDNVLLLEGRRNTSVDVDSKVILKAPARELAPFCSAEPDLMYLRLLAGHLSKKGCTLKMGPIVNREPDGSVHYFPKHLRAIEPAS